MITAPYNFVPLNKEIFYPSWSNNGKEISHDIPFEDGESGEIDITITAKTPIFIRNHYQEGDEFYKNNDMKISKEFCHIKTLDGAKQFYIPGSSLKGTIRNVLEIMSFGKIRVDKSKLSKYLSVRDMTQDKKTGEIFNYPMVSIAQKCGFLKFENNNYFIEDCGNILKIHKNEIEKVIFDFDIDLESAEDKYENYGEIDFPFVIEEIEKDGRKSIRANYDSKSIKKAKLVFTGSIEAKKNEFLFFPSGNKKDVDVSVYEAFEKVYFLNEDSIDGQFWKKQFSKSKKIPVFYIEESNKIKAIGLTQIFKLAYKKTLFDAIIQDNDDTKLDFCETIFGTEKEKLELKGRVQFSHLKSTNVLFEKEKNEILGSPQPTYYPNYISQTKANNEVSKYMTLMDADSKISGYKRYPLHKNIKKSYIVDEEKKDIQTHFKPLDKNTIFKGKIRFHNLKKVEIGGLLSAITFHNSKVNKHNLGMAKSLGYGKVDIDIKINGLKYTIEEYLKEFELEMTIHNSNWINSIQIKELFSISNDNIINDTNLKYQRLENKESKEKEKNDFLRAKKNKEYLKNYSKIGNIQEIDIKILSLLDQKEIEHKQKLIKEEKEWKRVSDLFDISLIEKFIFDFPESTKIEQAQEIIKQIKQKQEKQKQEEFENKINEKWNAIQKVDLKFKQKALEDFIANYSNSDKIEFAKKELESFSNTVKLSSNSIVNLDDLKNAKDGKKVKFILDKLSNIDENQEIEISNIIKDLYPSLKAKEQKSFFKDAQIGRYIGKNLEDELKNFFNSNK